MTPLNFLLMLIVLLPFISIRLAETGNQQYTFLFIALAFVVYSFVYYKNKADSENISFWDSIKKDLFLISPFKILLFFLITFIVWIFVFSQSPNTFSIFLVTYILYSIWYYSKMSKEENISIWQSVKNDLPTFSKPDMKTGHIVAFLLISFPILFLVIALSLGAF